MTLDALLIMVLNGLASASGLFFVAAGLSLIFGVTRIVNMAHGSFYMLGAYLAARLALSMPGALGFWGSLVLAAVLVGALGLVIEVVLLRRIYHVPELFQLLATFALVLVINDAVLFAFGPQDLLGPRAPGLRGAVDILGRRMPSYDLFMIVAGPVMLLGLTWLLRASRFGRLVRAATEDRDMVAALGVNQSLLFSLVFGLGAALAGLGGALQMAREPASLQLDMAVLGDAFVIVVVGGMGSIPGAYLAAVLIAEIKALCIGIGNIEIAGVALNVSKLTLVAEFLVMAVVLITRPFGLLGRAQALGRGAGSGEHPILPATPALIAIAAATLLGLGLVPVAAQSSPYALVIGTDVFIAVIFAASLHLIMGPGGMHSFGHAAYFGLGAYGAALIGKWAGAPLPVALLAAIGIAGLGAMVFGWFAVRLSGVYLAMLTLAFAQITWSIVFQWEAVTGGSNGIIGIWPAAPFDTPAAYYLLGLAAMAASLVLLRLIVFSPFGLALRAARDSPLRAAAIGIAVTRVQWIAFVIAGAIGGLAGGLFAYAKGSIAPESLHVSRSIDGLVMVLLGGLQTLSGPLVGAASFTLLQDSIMRQTEFWRALLGGVILVLVLAFPGGLVGALARLARGWRYRL